MILMQAFCNTGSDFHVEKTDIAIHTLNLARIKLS